MIKNNIIKYHDHILLSLVMKIKKYRVCTDAVILQVKYLYSFTQKIPI